MSSHFSTDPGESMWCSLVLRVLIFFRLASRPDFVVRIVNRHPVPEELHDGELITVQDGGRRKWACLRCPGGCGEKLQLALSSREGPRWIVRLDWLRRPSVTPSVRQINDCRCHFWIIGGRVHWCADSGQGPDRSQSMFAGSGFKPFE